jgi:hypothetical protein
VVEACPCGRLLVARLHEHLPPDTISLAVPGFKVSEHNVNRLLNQLRDLCLTENDTVVLDLSNTASLGTNENGLPSEPTRGDDGRYHITGSLASAPASFLKLALKTCQSLNEEVAKAGMILVAPTSRYITGKCCDDPGHIENFNDKDFEESVVAGVEVAKSLLDTWGTELGLNYVLIYPMLIANSDDLELRKRKIE